MKRFLRTLLLAALIAALALPAAVSAEEDRPADIPEEVTIYALDQDFEEYLTIPADLPRSWTLEGHSLKRYSGCSIEIDGSGTVTPYLETRYYHQIDGGWWVSSSNPSGLEGEIVKTEYEFGTCVILVDDKWEVTVHVTSYASHYAQQVMDGYLAEKVTEGMTQYQIADLCCQFVAGYDYSADASSSTGMIVTGGGDCWASVDTLLYMLRQKDIKCQSRSASTLPGAGSRHVNVVAELDGMFYTLEAGYDEPAPRDYLISKMDNSTIFTYSKRYENGQYQAYISGLILKEGITEIVIPSQIDGMPVTGIEDGAFSANHELVSVTLPDTIRYLGTRAFYQNYALESINLPEGLETIGTNCFAYCNGLTELTLPSTVTTIDGHFCCYCENLTAINVHPDNASFASRDGVLFDKAIGTLLIFPQGKGDYPYDREYDDGSRSYKTLDELKEEYTIPDSVRSIYGWSFAGVSLNTVHIPDSVSVIESNAFNNSRILNLALPDGMESITSNAFEDSDLGSLTLPASLKRIEDYAFYSSTIGCTVTIPDGVEYVGDYAFAGNLKIYATVPASVQEIGTGAFDFDLNWGSMDSSGPVSYYHTGAIFFDRDCQPAVIEDGAFDDETLCVYPDSYMHTYAVNNGLRWYARSEDGTVALKQEWYDGLSWVNDTSYTGEPIEVDLDWKYTEGFAPFYINSNSFDISYSDNINIGTVQMTITGKGLLSGTVTAEFTIGKVDPEENVIDRSGCGLQYKIEDGQAVIVGYIASALPAQLVIPDTLEGLPVSKIGYYAFEDCEILTDVTIPASVTEIEFDAFTNAPNLKTIHFAGDMPQIEWKAFDGGTAYYPAGNDTWNLSEIKYSGIAEWIALCADHVLGEWVTEKEPTCTADGQRTRSCASCGEGETEAIPATGHTAVADPAVAPTCTSSGLTEGSHCSVCGEVLTERLTVSPTGHTAVTDPAVAPTCTTSGLTEGSHCSVCNKVLVERTAVSPAGHSYSSVVTAPTCQAQGCTTHTCTVCGDSYTDSHTPIADHSYGQWRVIAPATCTAEGTRQRDCIHCGHIETQGVALAGHSYTDQVTGPTCTEPGYTTHTCSACGDSYVDSQTEALGHTQNGWILDEQQHWSYCIRGHKYDGADHSYSDDGDKSCDICGYEREISKPASLLGDVDGSGSVDFFDGMIVLQYYAGLISDAGLDVSAADVDENGSIDFFDGMYILQYYAGILSKLPVEA